MCGFFFTFNKGKYFLSQDKFKIILDTLNRRGPDDEGIEFEIYHNNFLQFGFKRLSIQDLSQNGHQPMKSQENSTILFNGEIYNHYKLRKEINKKRNILWKGTSDTETIINYLDIFGIDSFLENSEGMFAFLYFNKNQNKLILARDLAGEKPLYIYNNHKLFSCSSDLESFKKLDSFEKEISKKALSSFLNYSYVPSPITIYKSVIKLPAASKLEINLKDFNLLNTDSFDKFINLEGVKYTKWWNLKKKKNIHSNLDKMFVASKISNLIESSVKDQLISDAPLGAFLSGGIDSSLVVAMATKFKKNLKTFTIGYEFDQMDESKYATKVANYLKTDHENIICNKNHVIDSISKIQDSYSEPFADSSQIPTLLISQMASKKVKVVLSGDGGDEIFGGYNRYLIAYRYWKAINLIPVNLRNFFIKILLNMPLKLQDFLLNLILSKKIYLSNSNTKKILDKLIFIKDEFSFYDSFISEYNNKFDILLDTDISPIKYEKLYNSFQYENVSENMMASDFNTYLPDDILCKVDRATMYNGLESRAPLLNKKLIQYIFDLPFNFKIYNNKTKWIQKKILSKYIPESLFDRPKMGFGIPLGRWFRNELRNLMEDSLSDEMNNKHMFFNKKQVRNLMNDHLKCHTNNEFKLWSLIQFNLWYEKNYKNA